MKVRNHATYYLHTDKALTVKCERGCRAFRDKVVVRHDRGRREWRLLYYSKPQPPRVESISRRSPADPYKWSLASSCVIPMYRFYELFYIGDTVDYALACQMWYFIIVCVQYCMYRALARSELLISSGFPVLICHTCTVKSSLFHDRTIGTV